MHATFRLFNLGHFWQKCVNRTRWVAHRETIWNQRKYRQHRTSGMTLHKNEWLKIVKNEKKTKLFKWENLCILKRNIKLSYRMPGHLDIQFNPPHSVSMHVLNSQNAGFSMSCNISRLMRAENAILKNCIIQTRKIHDFVYIF